MSLSDHSSNNWSNFDDHGPPELSQAQYTTFFSTNSSSVDTIQPYYDHFQEIFITNLEIIDDVNILLLSIFG